MSEKVLYVDDEPNLLSSFQRTLGRQYAVTTACGGQEGLRVAQEAGPFAVVLSDMRMPGMDGVTFLSTIKTRSPETTCMMLTGYADLDTAMKAVNEGRIFRFLTKPCAREILGQALDAGIQQYRLVVAERELLQRTLTGSIRVLAEVLSLVNPTAFSRTMRLRNYTGHMVAELGLPQPWQYDIAAMLSQIGCVTLPPATMEKLAAGRSLTQREQEMVQAHPSVAARLLESIPRMETVSRIIARQGERITVEPSVNPATAEGAVSLGSQMLRLLSDFDALVVRGLPLDAVMGRLRQKPGEYPDQLLGALEVAVTAEIDELPKRPVKEVTVWHLEAGMVPLDDIVAESGVLVVPKGQEITDTLIVRLRNFASGVPIREPIRVVCPIGSAADARKAATATAA